MTGSRSLSQKRSFKTFQVRSNEADSQNEELYYYANTNESQKMKKKRKIFNLKKKNRLDLSEQRNS